MKLHRRTNPMLWVLLIGLAIVTLQGCSEDSTSPQIDEPSQTDPGISLTVIPHAENTLMAVASVLSDSAGVATIVFSSEGTDERSSQGVAIGANEAVEISVVGMRAQTEYSLKVVVNQGNGLENESASVLHTTGSLPGNSPTVTLSHAAEGNSAGGITEDSKFKHIVPFFDRMLTPFYYIF